MRIKPSRLLTTVAYVSLAAGTANADYSQQPSYEPQTRVEQAGAKGYVVSFLVGGVVGGALVAKLMYSAEQQRRRNARQHKTASHGSSGDE